MIEVKQVVIRISRPSGTDPGRVESAWYRVIKDMVTLTDREGVPLSKEAPSARRATRVEARWEAPLPPDSDDDAPRRIAGRILQAKWRASHGSDFRTRQLHYPRGMSPP